jgi:hypothetical protein
MSIETKLRLSTIFFFFRSSRAKLGAWMRGKGAKWSSSLRIYVLVSLAGQEGREEKRQRRIRSMRRGVRLVVSTWRVMPRRPACPTVSPTYNLRTRAALPYIALLTLSSFFFNFAGG